MTSFIFVHLLIPDFFPVIMEGLNLGVLDNRFKSYTTELQLLYLYFYILFFEFWKIYVYALVILLYCRCHFRRIILRILYFGWDYKGLAVQEDSTKTIEHCLFQALSKSCLIVNRETSNYHRCGRTDKGVSSFGQVWF